MLKRIKAGVLEVAYFDQGPSDGAPVLLLHGFPYDTHAYDEVIPVLVSNGCRVIVPYLRGYGPTRFLYANNNYTDEYFSAGVAPKSVETGLRSLKSHPKSADTT